jgi:xanthine dehydrogenase accessory factor
VTGPIDRLCVLRGGGDLATGVAWRLHRAGYPVVVLELAAPLTVRRTVALSSAVVDGVVSIEGMIGRRVDSLDDALSLAGPEVVPVVVSPELPPLVADVVVDARMAKRNVGTGIHDAALVIALGPGFIAGFDCHAVVETMRGPRLGRVLWRGSAEADNGTPGTIGGQAGERVLRAPVAGVATWVVEIGEVVTAGQLLGQVGSAPLAAPFDGLVRGLIRPGTEVPAGLKVGDVDPRLDVSCREISDKALAIGGGVLEAVLAGRAPDPDPAFDSDSDLDRAPAADPVP